MAHILNINRAGKFIDLFSGCGGLSLGLMQAGWQGIFAIEKTEAAFSTLSNNLLNQGRYSYTWPDWLPRKNMEVGELIANHAEDLRGLRGAVDLIAGGPPCQGFSTAGKRDPNDPRNKLAEQYIKVVELVRPNYLILENVRGFNISFKKEDSNGQLEKFPYSLVVKKKLEEIGYGVSFKVVKSSDWGVPQHRPRFILIAKYGVSSEDFDPFADIEPFRKGFLRGKGLRVDRPVSAGDAIQDLETFGKKLISNKDSQRNGFYELSYQPPENLNAFLSIVRVGLKNEAPNSMRLARHSDAVRSKFTEILNSCPRGVTVSKSFKAEMEIKKQAITPLSKDLPSATVTTLPDDIIHYAEPRILTVRENARLQTFPDWFEFTGAYTTGGKQRKNTCPRYTQVGNAVPPLLAEAMGLLIGVEMKRAT